MYEADTESLAAALMQARQTTLPKRLLAPGPDAAQLLAILGAAASAPDHAQLLPWRFVLVPQAARARLADVFGAALLERDATATADQVQQAMDKAFRSPCLMLVVVQAGGGVPDIDLFERIVSAGAAVQNMLLMATAQGYGSALTSGKALKAQGLRRLFALSATEHALCFVNIGTAQTQRQGRVRPQPKDYVSMLGTQGLEPWPAASCQGTGGPATAVDRHGQAGRLR